MAVNPQHLSVKLHFKVPQGTLNKRANGYTVYNKK